MVKERSIRREIFKNSERKITLTPFQLGEILRFLGPNDDGKYVEGGALGGLLTKEEQDSLRNASLSSSLPLFEIPVFSYDLLPGLINFFRAQPSVKAVLEKISKVGRLYVFTEEDLQTELSFRQLPFILQYALSKAGKDIFGQIKDFLKEGGIVTLFVFEEPLPAYVEVLNKQAPNASLIEKVALALKPSDNDKELKAASHKFITINFIPPTKESPKPEKRGNFAHLRKGLNQRIEEFERMYAMMILFKFLAKEEMKEVIWTLVALTCAVPAFYALEKSLRDDLLAQATIKVLTHLISNLVNVYVQYKTQLEGENFFQQLKDFFRKLPKMREALIGVGAGFVIDPLSEVIGRLNQIAGAFVFGLEALVGSVLTTTNVLRERKFNGNQEGIASLIKENPAVLGINLGAAATVLTSVGILGLLDLFHNPAAVAFVGGVIEPLVATLTIKLYTTFGYYRSFYKKGKTSINYRLAVWKKAGLI